MQMNGGIFIYISDSCAFSICVCCNLFQCVIFLFYLIILYYYLLEVCLTSNKRQKQDNLGWEGNWGGTGRHKSRGN